MKENPKITNNSKSNFPYKENLMASTIYVKGLNEEILNNKSEESFIFHKG